MGPITDKRPRPRAACWRVELIAILLGVISVILATPARAIDLSALLEPDLAAADWLEGADTFLGVDATDSVLFSYSGFTLSPGRLDREGLRLRVYAGAGRYTYVSGTEGTADLVQAEALVGWQFHAGLITAKLFAGIAYEAHTIDPGEPDIALRGGHVGAKVALETWFDLSERAWLSADASYATAIDSYSGSTKLGLKPVAWLSLGPEAAAFGNQEFEAHRLGGFARWHCGGCDVTVSGGVSGDYDDDTGAYGALAFYTRF